MPADVWSGCQWGATWPQLSVQLGYRFRPVCTSKFRLSILGCPQPTPSVCHWTVPTRQVPQARHQRPLNQLGQVHRNRAGPRGGTGTSPGTLFSSICSQFPRLVLARRLGKGK